MNRSYYYVYKTKPVNKHSLNVIKIEIIFLFILLAGNFLISNPFKSSSQIKSPVQNFSSNQQVQGVSTTKIDQLTLDSEIIQTITPTISPLPTLTPTPSPTNPPTPTPIKVLPKKTYTIAITGDSMVDTMGEHLEYLETSLKKEYPQNQFQLYNYGKGSENVEQGLARFNDPFNYKDRHYSALSKIKPDVIIVDSYAYNPFSPYDRDRHWLGLTRLIQEAQKVTKKVYILADIAPLKKDFGKGPNGVNWDSLSADKHVIQITEQLENAIGLSRTLNVPLINVFERSKEKENNDTNKLYVDTNDGIHPSIEGQKLTAETIVSTIDLTH